MTRAAVLFAALILVLAPILAFSVTLTDEEQAQCDEHGGCVTVTLEHLREKLGEVFEKGCEAGRVSCGNRV